MPESKCWAHTYEIWPTSPGMPAAARRARHGVAEKMQPRHHRQPAGPAGDAPREGAPVFRKISRLTGTPDNPVEHEFDYANTFFRERMAEGTERLTIGLCGGQSTVFRASAQR
jgi:hypothetical protein